jgi:hypothetical protein
MCEPSVNLLLNLKTIHVGAASNEEGVHLAVNSYDNGNKTF